jgi:hypothetical protein
MSGSNAGYNMFRGSVKSTGYSVLSLVSPFTFPPLHHHVPSHFIWTLLNSFAPLIVREFVSLVMCLFTWASV